jgi:hypothetical protein
MLEKIGLRTRPTPKRPGKALSRNGVYRMLRDDYYVGIVTHNGVKREGRHEALVDPAIFEKVQRTLASNRLAGDRSHKHAHYLKGSIFCGHCGGRLIYGRHRGKGGVYDYFRCLSGQRRQACGGRYLPVDQVEQAIERYYGTIELTPTQCEEVRRELKQQVGDRLARARKHSERHQRRLRDLQAEQQKLLQLFYRGGVDEDVLQAEQERIAAERSQARQWVETASTEASEATDALDEALALVENAHAVYVDAEPEQRRMMNQAIFAQLLVRIDLLEGEETPIFSQIRSFGSSSTLVRANPHKNQDPRFSGGLGYNMIKMVRAEGLEPPRACAHRLLRPACLPIPPRPRSAGAPSLRGRGSAATCGDCMVIYTVSARAARSAPDVIVTHPNRDKPVVRATRATVIALLLVSAALVLVITVGGFEALEGGGPIAIQCFFILVYLLLALFAGRWNRGVLPVAAALAVLLGTFALVAAPAWFNRDKTGFAQPALDAGLLGILTLLVIPVQILLVAFAMRGFSQGWNVERELHRAPARGEGYGTGAPHPA